MKTNDIRHTINTKDKDGNTLIINVRLNDECNNGHQDFSITGNIYEKGKPKIDKYYLAGGCTHEEILKARPDLQIFVDLHLCDYMGIPMHAIANGFFHMFQDQMGKEKFCNYYRITKEQYKKLRESETKVQYALLLQSLGILKQWKQQADKAITLLEKMTG